MVVPTAAAMEAGEEDGKASGRVSMIISPQQH